MEIKIGRRVTGEKDIVVPDDFKKVSRTHATAVYEDGKLYIRDDGSSNGTYIKGRNNPIARSEIHQGDVLLLGGSDANNPFVFTIPYDKIMEKIVGVSYDITHLREVYENYETEIKSIKDWARKQTLKPRLIATLIGACIALVGYFGYLNVEGDASNKGAVALRLGLSVVGVLTMLSNFFIKTPDVKDKVVDVQIKYAKDYCCPNKKCGQKYNFDAYGHHWKSLLNSGCPYCKAKFKM